MSVVDFYLRIDGIEGESADAKHKGSIELDSWGWGEQQPSSPRSSSGAGAGKVSMQDFRFVAKASKASPKLALVCASGEHLKKAVLTCRKAGKGQQEYITWTFHDCLVTSYSTGGPNGGNILPCDQVSVNYARVEYQYKAQNADGSMGGPIKFGWDLQANKAM